jgi:hypothetical protein
MTPNNMKGKAIHKTNSIEIIILVTLTCMMVMIRKGSTDIGIRIILNKERETNAFSASRT